MDSRSAFHLYSTMRKPKEIKNEIMLESTKEEFYLDSMETICWTSGQSHLADALTIDKQEIAKTLNSVSTSGIHSYLKSSYTARSDVPGVPSYASETNDSPQGKLCGNAMNIRRPSHETNISPVSPSMPHNSRASYEALRDSRSIDLYWIQCV